ncbi:MAG: L,D-transpeptidase [Bacteroidota bacterium]|nr:L,D-transpeptidase [Bacteroidota bacterium]
MKTRTLILSIFSFLFFSFIPGNNYWQPLLANRHIDTNSVRKTESANPYYIIISKKNYELKVYDDQGWYATYPCVFGSNDFRDKYMAGDKRTPEGKFKILLKRNNTKWKYELLLDYPNQESYKKFDERKAEGLIPRNAQIGGGIAIHATRPQEEWTVDYYQNWTDGCVSLKYTEAADLYSYIPVGTPVTIEK